MGTRILGVTGSTLIAVGDGKVAAWTIPTGDHVFDARMNINDSIRITILDQPGLPSGDLFGFVSMSPGPNRIAILEGFRNPGYLRIYDMSTGGYLGASERGRCEPPASSQMAARSGLYVPSSRKGGQSSRTGGLIS